MKKLTFSTLQILNYWAEYKENHYISVIFLKFTLPARGGHLDHSPQAPKNLATSLRNCSSADVMSENLQLTRRYFWEEEAEFELNVM